MGDPTELFQILFMSTEIYGYIGIGLLLSLALLTTKKENVLGYVWMVILAVMGVNYFTLLTETGYYALHIVLCFVGELLCLGVILSDH